MFGSNVLDICIGIAVYFSLLSLITSALKEILEGLIRVRAITLRNGLEKVLSDKAAVESLYNDPWIKSLCAGSGSLCIGKGLPSYIPSENFVLALISIVKSGRTGTMQIPPSVVQAVGNIASPLQDDMEDAIKLAEIWFNNAMERVAGDYKRYSQFALLVIGFVLAFFLNADAIQTLQALSKDASLRQCIVAEAQTIANKAASNKNTGVPPSVLPQISSSNSAASIGNNKLPDTRSGEAQKESAGPIEQIEDSVNEMHQLNFPIGWRDIKPDATVIDPNNWRCLCDPDRFAHVVAFHIVGWLVTAIGVSLGAPFWFDLLGKFMSVRNTGDKPTQSNSDQKYLTRSANLTPVEKKQNGGDGK